jgi:hypothetical protein
LLAQHYRSFIALLKDHSKTEASRDRQYPQNPVFVYEFSVTQAELFKIGTFIRNKANEYEKYLTVADDDIPPCSPQERWDRPSKFAVKKEGRQKAVKLFDVKEEAEQRAEELGTGHFVEHRVGESVKCQNYCLCCGYCDYYQTKVIGLPERYSPSIEQNAKKIAA